MTSPTREQYSQQASASSSEQKIAEATPFGPAETSRPVSEQAVASPVASPDDQADERSPLLSSNGSEPDDSRRQNIPAVQMDETQTTKGLWYMIMLTISIAGLQIAWAVELSNGSPYLLSLGLSKSLMALVWIAGPLTGTLVVPYVGILSDNCRVPWGKRRPFMIGGTIATVLALLFLAWTQEIVGGILGLFGADPQSHGVKIVVIIAAVIGVYILDIAINTVQAAIRAFIVDCAPAHQQEEANSMASRVTGVGNIVGYIAGYINLPTYLWFLGDNQFKILCAIASIGLTVTVVLSASIIHERDPRLDGPSIKKTPGIFSFFFNIYKSIKRLPPQTKRVCQVQFFAWIGFFPLLFYTSSYIGEIYAQPFLEANPHMTQEELDALYEKATRVGTFALLVNSIVSLLTNFFLPFFVAPTFDSQPLTATKHAGHPSRAAQAEPSRWQSYLDCLRVPGLTLKRAWIGSLFLFSGTMFCTVLVRSVAGATVLIGLAGVTWAMTLWAPFAIISAEVSRRDVLARAKKLQNMAPHGPNDPNEPSSSRGSQDTDVEVGNNSSEDEEVDQAGVILGIHNMALAAPQMISTLGSSLIFKFVQKPRGTPGDHSFAIVMALGGICVLGSCYFAFRLRDDAGSTAEVVDDDLQGRALLAGER